MFTNILVPLDGSALAARIIPHVTAMSDEGDVITLLRVLETDDFESAPVDPLAWHFAKAEAGAYLEEAASRLAPRGEPPATVVLEGRASLRIVEFAQTSGADLIVLSSHGKGGLSAWNISGIALKVIHRAGTSILLVRSSSDHAEVLQDEHSARIQYRSILVPLDGSQRAESVLPIAIALAERHGADLLVVHIVLRPELMQRVPLSQKDVALAERVVARNQAEAERYFGQLAARLPARARTRILVDESVSRALHTLVELEQVDLVMLSAHGHVCNSDLPYSALVNNFITYGRTSLLILQDLPSTVTRRGLRAQSADELVTPSRRTTDEEGPNIRAEFNA